VICAGTFAWAWVVFITHSDDLYRVGMPLKRAAVPSAFRNRGGPLTDEHGIVGLIDDRGFKRILIAEAAGKDRIRVGTAFVDLTHIVRLPSCEWNPLLASIRAALGL
jgi:hypothetical protein